MAFQPNWVDKITKTYADYKKGDIVIAKDVDEKGAKNFTLFRNIQTLEQYINTSPEKNFYDCYYYSSKENIKNYPVKLAFDIDIGSEIDASLKDTIIFIIYEIKQNICFMITLKKLCIKNVD